MVVVGVLALQGGFAEHINLLQRAADHISRTNEIIDLVEVRTSEQLHSCDALIIPGGESTTLSLVAVQSGLIEPLREFVKVSKRPVWGTCAGLILLCDEASATKRGGQELIGGLSVKVHRNHFGRQLNSFVRDMDLGFLESVEEKPRPFPAIFIRAPVVEHLLKEDEKSGGEVEILARISSEGGTEEIVALRQDNVFGTSFHPELTDDMRIHVWWLNQVMKISRQSWSNAS
ncbi:PdxT/SNO family [Xylariaceae sp. FL0255]|nr:PdxT/SNO family [Xylariaceae sp. FL0255]